MDTLNGRGRTAHNIKFKEVNFLKGLVVYQSVVLLSECVLVQKMRTALLQKSLFICSRFLREQHRSESLKKFTSLSHSPLVARLSGDCGATA